MVLSIIIILVIIIYVIYLLKNESKVDLNSNRRIYYTRELLRSIIELKNVIESENSAFLEIDLMVMKMNSLIEDSIKHKIFPNSINFKLGRIKFYRVVPKNEFSENLNLLIKHLMEIL